MILRRFGNRKKKWWSLGGDGAALAASLNQEKHRFDPLHISLVCHLTPFVDPFLKLTGDNPFTTAQFQIKRFMSPAQIYIGASMRSIPRLKPGIDWEQLNQTPEAMKFQMTQNDVTPVNENFAYELGRFITGQNEIGLIQSIQTGLAFDDNDLRWPRGDSRWHERNLAVDNGYAFSTWAIKVENGVDGNPNPKAFRTLDFTAILDNWVHNLPGVIHPEIMPWDTMLFLAGHDHYIHLRCAPGTVTSLWYICHVEISNTGLRSVNGIMKGFTQIQSSDRTYENMTRI